jgi:ankyrin repeat protein
LPYLATDDDEDDAAQLREASAMEGDGSDFTIYDRWNNLLEALTIAISIRDTDTAVVLIRAGADVAATNCFQQAIYKGDKEMVRFLLANGADKEAQLFLKDYAYVTPLIFAIEMENREIVQVYIYIYSLLRSFYNTPHTHTHMRHDTR